VRDSYPRRSKPVAATCDTSRMAMGEPGLPGEFIWHDETIRIARVKTAGGGKRDPVITGAASNTSANTGMKWRTRLGEG